MVQFFSKNSLAGTVAQIRSKFFANGKLSVIFYSFIILIIICYFAVPWVTFKVRNKQLVSDVDRLTEKSPDILKELETLKKGHLEIRNDLKTTRDELYEFRNMSQVRNKQLASDVDRLTEKSPEILKELEKIKKGQLEIRNDLKTTKDELYKFRNMSQALSKIQSELKQQRKEIEAMQSVSILYFTNFQLKFSLTLWLTYLMCF